MEKERLKIGNQCSLYESEEHCYHSLKNVTKLVHPTLDQSCSFSSENLVEPKFRGLGCRTNQSLNFYLLDSEQYPNYVSKLGHSSKNYLLKSNIAMIVDPEVAYFSFPRKTNELLFILNLAGVLLYIKRTVDDPKHPAANCKLYEPRSFSISTLKQAFRFVCGIKVVH